jgi:hypothetical protein
LRHRRSERDSQAGIADSCRYHLEDHRRFSFVRLRAQCYRSPQQTLFAASNVRYLWSPLLNKPIDLAPAVPEVAARNFASNTTLGGGSDFYVLNRGNNTIIRMRQDGHVVAARRIETDVPGFRVNGLAVSEDARTIWVTATAPGRQGVALRMPTFGSRRASPTGSFRVLQRVASSGQCLYGVSPTVSTSCMTAAPTPSLTRFWTWRAGRRR